MTTIPFDIARCAGRFDFEPDGDWCPMRADCQRYLAFVERDKLAGIPDYKGIPVMMGIPGCNDHIPDAGE